jgi:hypothetical protein
VFDQVPMQLAGTLLCVFYWKYLVQENTTCVTHICAPLSSSPFMVVFLSSITLS